MCRSLIKTAFISAMTLLLGPSVWAQEDASIIMIPSFTAPAEQPSEGTMAFDGGAESFPVPDAFSLVERTRQHAIANPADAEPEVAVAPLLSQSAGASPGRLIRLQGENPVAEFTIYLPAGAVPGQLLIAHMSGVDVLPDRSKMEVLVNGSLVGVGDLGNFDPETTNLFDVPENLWQAGRNDIVIRMEQVHRLFCGPEAAFDLWTDIDLTKSGAVLDARPLVPGPIDFLATVAHDVGIGLPIGMRDPEGLAVEAQPLLDELAHRLTELLGGRSITYRADATYEDAPASDSAAEQSTARITLLPTFGPPSVAFRRGGDGALVLALSVPREGLVPSEAGTYLDEAFAEASVLKPAEDMKQIQTGIDPRTQIVPGEPVTLETLGMPTTRTSSHYFRRDQIFTLPRDWLVLTAQKAELRLDYIYDRNLPKESLLLIRINGETVRMLPLYGDGGELIEEFPIKFYANLLNEGPNLLQFEALVPGQPEDAACPAGNFPKLEIRGSTTLTVPPSPKLRLSGLRLPIHALRSDAVTFNGGEAGPFNPTDRMTLVATLGPPMPRGSHMTALTLDRLGELPLGDYAISRGDIANVLTRGVVPVPDVLDPLPADRIGELPVDPFDPLETRSMENPSKPGGLVGIANGVLGTVFGTSAERLGERLDELVRRINPDAGAKAKNWLSEQSGKAVLAQLDPGDPSEFHVLLGPDTELTEVSTALAAARRSVGGPEGQIAVLGHDGTWHSWRDTHRLPALVEPLTIRNIRQVAGNYASWSPLTFIGLVFGVSLLFAMIALRIIVLTRGDKTS